RISGCWLIGCHPKEGTVRLRFLFTGNKLAVTSDTIQATNRADQDQAGASAHSQTVVIEPGKRWVPMRLRELWRYRELLYFLTWRDVKVRYKQTLLGAAWAILQPLLTMLIFTLLFGRLAGIPTGGTPYPLFA